MLTITPWSVGMEGMDMAHTPDLTTSREVYLVIGAWPRAIMAAEVGVR